MALVRRSRSLSSLPSSTTVSTTLLRESAVDQHGLTTISEDVNNINNINNIDNINNIANLPINNMVGVTVPINNMVNMPVDKSITSLNNMATIGRKNKPSVMGQQQQQQQQQNHQQFHIQRTQSHTTAAAS